MSLAACAALPDREEGNSIQQSDTATHGVSRYAAGACSSFRPLALARHEYACTVRLSHGTAGIRPRLGLQAEMEQEDCSAASKAHGRAGAGPPDEQEAGHNDCAAFASPGPHAEKRQPNLRPLQVFHATDATGSKKFWLFYKLLPERAQSNMVQARSAAISCCD